MSRSVPFELGCPPPHGEHAPWPLLGSGVVRVPQEAKGIPSERLLEVLASSLGCGPAADSLREWKGRSITLGDPEPLSSARSPNPHSSVRQGSGQPKAPAATVNLGDEPSVIPEVFWPLMPTEGDTDVVLPGDWQTQTWDFSPKGDFSGRWGKT